MKRIALLLAVAMLGGAAPPERVDLIIRGGTIYTGSDAPFVGDVAISGDNDIEIRFGTRVVAVLSARSDCYLKAADL